MNHYFTSDGERLTQGQINYRVSRAKEQALKNQMDEYGYNFCEECGANKNKAGKLDCSHDISVQKAKDSRKTELCYDVKIIVIRCRDCHKKHDKLDLKFTG